MRVIRNDQKTSFISIKARDSGSEIGVIQKSTTPRITEIAASESPYLPNREIVQDKPPGEGYAWCSHCGWRRINRFGKNAARTSGLDNYCLECRKRLRDMKKINL